MKESVPTARRRNKARSKGTGLKTGKAELRRYSTQISAAGGSNVSGACLIYQSLSSEIPWIIYSSYGFLLKVTSPYFIKVTNNFCFFVTEAPY